MCIPCTGTGGAARADVLLLRPGVSKSSTDTAAEAFLPLLARIPCPRALLHPGFMAVASKQPPP